MGRVLRWSLSAAGLLGRRQAFLGERTLMPGRHECFNGSVSAVALGNGRATFTKRTAPSGRAADFISDDKAGLASSVYPRSSCPPPPLIRTIEFRGCERLLEGVANRNVRCRSAVADCNADLPRHGPGNAALIMCRYRPRCRNGFCGRAFTLCDLCTHANRATSRSPTGRAATRFRAARAALAPSPGR